MLKIYKELEYFEHAIFQALGISKNLGFKNRLNKNVLSSALPILIERIAEWEEKLENALREYRLRSK